MAEVGRRNRLRLMPITAFGLGPATLMALTISRERCPAGDGPSDPEIVQSAVIESPPVQAASPPSRTRFGGLFTPHPLTLMGKPAEDPLWARSQRTIDLETYWPARAEVLRGVEKNEGKLVSAAKIPLFSSLLDRAFELVAREQELKINGVATSEMHVVIQEQPRVFVYPIQERGIDGMRSMVFVTTGFIKQMLHRIPQSLGEAERASLLLLKLIGALGHELGHGIDESENRGGGSLVDQQARELRADAEGVNLVRRAGLSPVGLLLALQDLHQLSISRRYPHQKIDQAVLHAAVSTHPHFEIRLIALRALLTVLRYEYGIDDTSLLVDQDQAQQVLREVEHRLPKPVHPRAGIYLQLPQSMEAWVQAMEGVLPSRRGTLSVGRDSDENSRVRFNALLRALSRLPIEAEGQKLEWFWSSVATWRDWVEGDLILTKSHLTGETDWLTGTPLFHRLLEQHPHFKSPDHLAWIELICPQLGEVSEITHPPKQVSASDPRSEEVYWSNSRLPRATVTETKKKEVEPDPWEIAGINLRSLSCLLPLDLVVQQYQDQLLDLMRQKPTEPFQVEGIDPRLQLRLGNLYFAEVWPTLSMEEKLEAVAHGTLSRVWGDPHEAERAAALSDREGRVGPAPDTEAVEAYRLHLGNIWTDRAFFALAELCGGENGRLPWEVWGRSLGQDISNQMDQIRAAVAWRLSEPTEDRRELLEALHVPKNIPHSTVKPCPWLNGSLVPFLRGDRLPEERNAFPRAFQRLSHHLLLREPRVAEVLLRRVLATQVLVPPPPDAEQFLERLARAHPTQFLGIAGRSRIVAEEIDRSTLGREDKALLLRQLFLPQEGDPSSFDRWWEKEPIIGQLTPLLLASEAIASASDLFEYFCSPPSLGSPEDSPERNNTPEARRATRRGYVGKLTPQLIDELQAARTTGRIPLGACLDRMRIIFENVAYQDPGSAQQAFNPSTELRDLKAAVAEVAVEQKLAPQAALKFFQALTGTGATEATDLFFLDQVFPLLEGREALVADLLDRGAIHSGRIRIQLARAALEPSLARLEAAVEQDRRHLLRDASSLIAALDNFVPQSSSAKDKYLEEIAWRLDLAGEELKSLIEDHKSYNWRRLIPMPPPFPRACGAKSKRSPRACLARRHRSSLSWRIWSSNAPRWSASR